MSYISARPYDTYRNKRGDDFQSVWYEVVQEKLLRPKGYQHMKMAAHMHCEAKRDQQEWIRYPHPTQYLEYKLYTGYIPRMRTDEPYKKISDDTPDEWYEKALAEMEKALEQGIIGKKFVKRDDRYVDVKNRIMYQVYDDPHGLERGDHGMEVQVRWATAYKTDSGALKVAMYGRNPAGFFKTGKEMTRDEVIKDIMGMLREKSDAVKKVFLEEYCTHKR